MLYKNVSLKTIVMYQEGQLSPRAIDPGEVVDGELYPDVKKNPVFTPYTPPKPKIPPKTKVEQQKDDVFAIASAYQNLVVHMSKMKSDMAIMANQLQELRDEVELLKTPPNVDALYKINEPVNEVNGEEEVELMPKDVVEDKPKTVGRRRSSRAK